jgi:hypothetical protein
MTIDMLNCPYFLNIVIQYCIAKQLVYFENMYRKLDLKSL